MKRRKYKDIETNKEEREKEMKRRKCKDIETNKEEREKK